MNFLGIDSTRFKDSFSQQSHTSILRFLAVYGCDFDAGQS